MTNRFLAPATHGAAHVCTALRSASLPSHRPPMRVLALCLALWPAAVFAQAPEGGPDKAAQLESVLVTGLRADGLRPETVEAGTFRGADIMDVPSTVNVVTREALELQVAGGLYDALRNTAGVTRQQNGGETWDQLVIRGIGVENRTNYRVNGSLPYLNFSQVALENKERVEVLKGASALYYGFTSPAGVVNLVTKRAGAEPVATLGVSADSNGGVQASADVGRRFGETQQYGLRVNAAGGALGSYLDGVDEGDRRFVSAAFDWRVNERLTLRADVEYDRRDTTEQVGVQLPAAVDGVITLPRTVDPSRLVGPDWATFRAETRNALLRADLELSDNWALTVEAGHAEVERKRQLPVFRFDNAAAVATGAGNLRGNSQTLNLESDMARAELFGVFETGAVRHELTLGSSYTTKDQAPIYQQNYTVAEQNLYDPLPISNSVSWGAVPATPTTAAYSTRDTGYYAIDRMSLGAEWQVVAGLRHARYRSNQGGLAYAPSKTAPLAAVIYRPAEALSFYASYAEGLEEGEAAPAGTDNVGTRLAPGVSKQKELGARWQAPAGTLVSAAVFDILRPGYYTSADNVYTAGGEQRYRGLELSAQGRLSQQLGWQASALWLDPEFRNIGPDYDGKLPENAARRTASLFLAYDLAAVPGLTLSGGAYYTGRRPVDDRNQAWLDDVTLYAAGLRYNTRLFGKLATWQVNVENLADKRYWAAGGTRLAAGAPRTLKALLKVAL
ncbi:MAG: TonB-dependent siderophore receptor [Rhodocyclaceae bacterium]